MEVTEGKKITTKDMAGVESEREQITQPHQNFRSREEIGLNPSNGEKLVPLLSPKDGDRFR